MANEDQVELDEIVNWFADRGFLLKLMREEDNLAWADLCRLPSGELVAREYGTADSEVGAARRARRRFEEEQ
jgi:hypothetical protein